MYASPLSAARLPSSLAAREASCLNLPLVDTLPVGDKAPASKALLDPST
ncbi:hypothetical protein P4501_05935 [Bacillus thuringiensis]|nr:hypothetical protein [Bacillus thuringiensis]